MRISLKVAGREWIVEDEAAVELAIALDFHGEQTRAFGLPSAKTCAVEAGDFVGDTRRGGSANCETLTVTPHGNGTHTEVVGHITEERIAIGDAVAEPLWPAALLTVPLRRLEETSEEYGGSGVGSDRVVCAADLDAARKGIGVESEFLGAVVVRIDPEVRPFEPLDDHTGTNPPYLSAEAVRWLGSVGCEHLLVEIPSVDREDDGGGLTNHHLFFGLEPGESPDAASRRRTITEMIGVPETLRDGRYALSLRFPRLKTDAAPSRPLLYPLRERN